MRAAPPARRAEWRPEPRRGSPRRARGRYRALLRDRLVLFGGFSAAAARAAAARRLVRLLGLAETPARAAPAPAARRARCRPDPLRHARTARRWRRRRADASIGARSETIPSAAAAVHTASICSALDLERRQSTARRDDFFEIYRELIGVARIGISFEIEMESETIAQTVPARTRPRALRPARSRRTAPASATKARRARPTSRAHPSRR